MGQTTYAGFWLRFVAVIIDNLIIDVLQFFLIIPLLASFGLTFFTLDVGEFNSLSEEDLVVMIPALISLISSVALLSFLVKLLYYALMESSKSQATLGKMALGIIVTDTNGERLDFTKAMIRQLFKLLSGMIMMIGYLMAGFTEKKQALHDIIANTYVVKK